MFESPVCTHLLAAPSLLTNLSYFCFAEVSESVFQNFKCLVLFVGLTLLSALLLLLLVLLLHQSVLPLWSFSHLTKRHANHSAAGASLAACGSFNRCQCASYGRRLNQLLNSDRESAQLKCAFYHSGCESTQAKTG